MKVCKNLPITTKLAWTLLLTTLAFTGSGIQAAPCTVDGGTTFQTIDGFGFSDGWSGTLSSAKNNALYGTLGLSIFRAFINPNAGAYVTPAANISAARAAGAKVFATGWANRSWGVNGHLPSSRYAEYADWLRAQAASKNFDYVSPFNEPDGNVATEIRWTPTEILNFIKNQAPTIGKPIMMPESIGFNDSYSDPVLNDATASNNIAIVAGHFYGNGNRIHQKALDRGKRVWETEHFIPNSQTDITAAVTFAKEVSDAMNNRFSAYCWWWVNDHATDGSNLVDSSGTIFKNGYVLGQFAKYVKPGKVRIGATYNPTAGVYVTAYRTNGIVIVAVNTGASSVTQAFTINNILGLTSFNVNRTSSTENMASESGVNLVNNTFTYTLPAQSITTFYQYSGNTSSAPSAPTSLTATAVSFNQINLNWAASNGATSYTVKRSTTSSGTYTTVASGITGTSYSNTNLIPGTVYYFVVSASDTTGESPNSSQASTTTNAAPSLYEAENAVLSGPTVQTEHTGYTGTGYIDFASPSNDYVEFTVGAHNSGIHTLSLHYANGGTASRPLKLAVNGTVATTALAFPATGSWATWSTVNISIFIPAGTNTVRITATGASGPNIDSLKVQ